MDISIYSVYDRVTCSYGDPFFAVNEEDCLRRCAFSFRNNPYVKDLVLYRIGSFNHDSGRINAFENPFFVCNIINLISPVPSEVTADEQ